MPEVNEQWAVEWACKGGQKLIDTSSIRWSRWSAISAYVYERAEWRDNDDIRPDGWPHCSSEETMTFVRKAWARYHKEGDRVVRVRTEKIDKFTKGRATAWNEPNPRSS